MVPRTVEEAKCNNVSRRPYMNLCMPFTEYMTHQRKEERTYTGALPRQVVFSCFHGLE